MATVNELARASRVPRPKLYEVLEGLNKRGLVEIVPETPQRFRAASISAFFEHRVAELKTEEQELKRLVGEISLYLAQAPRAAGAEGDAAFIHTVHGRTHFAVNLRRMVQESQHSLDVVGDRLLLARLRMHEEILRSIAVASKRIAVRVLAPENAVDQVEGRRIHMDEIAEVLRRAPFPLGDAFLVVRDEQESMVVRFMPNDLHPSRGNDRVVVSRDPEFAALWHRLANQAWDAGVAWPGARAR